MSLITVIDNSYLLIPLPFFFYHCPLIEHETSCFGKKGSRRRGRSHARSCCAEELQSFQTLHVIGRDGRQHSPTGSQQEQPLVDYRRLVFISSDSSSGREEDDADSSCSSSSFLNGLPRAGSRTQSLEDCDWDYFESGSLPLPAGVPVAISTSNVGTETSAAQDWSCCPGRGSTACQVGLLIEIYVIKDPVVRGDSIDAFFRKLGCWMKESVISFVVAR